MQARAIVDLKNVDPTFFKLPGQQDADGAKQASRPIPMSSSATSEHLQALVTAAREELDPEPFRDKQMSRAVVARALAGAIDHLASSAYLEWFRAEGQVTIKKGQPYPVFRHDPRRWLGQHRANTDPANFPDRDLTFTDSLRIATGKLGFTYVLDFGLWARLDLLGAEDDQLVMSAAQPNIDFSELEFRWHGKTTPTTYSNHGPFTKVPQADRIIRLVDTATAQRAQVVLVPEYSVTESVYTALKARLPKSANPPILFCAGLVRDTLAKTGWMENEGWLLVNTPGISLPYSEHFHAKTSAAKVAGAVESIRAASEIRVFVGERWSLCVLICVEVLAKEIIDQLVMIGTNLVLVPAMSEKTTSMAASVGRLCTESQAFVVMANGPAAWPMVAPASRCEAFFAGPYESNPASWCLTLADAGRNSGQIATWVFPVSQRSVSMHQLTP